jgi:flagellar motor switch protein FliG
MNLDSDGIRKAAILVASLDRAAADQLLDRIDPARARQIRQMALELDSIDAEEQRQVIDEFLRIRPRVQEELPTGIELDGRLAQSLFSSPRPFASEEAEAEDGNRAEGPPFRFLHEAEGEKLVSLLTGERPQTIALILSHLPPDQAGKVLAGLPAALQVDVLHRLVDLEETEPEILQEVERALESRFSKQLLKQRRRMAGLAAVAGILEASDGHVGREILGNLAARDHRLARRLCPQRIDFDELCGYEGAALGTIFRAAGRELAALALVGAAPALIERVLAQLPASQAGVLRDRLDHPGPTRLTDVEEARRRIAALAERLAMEGRIDGPHVRPSPDQFAPVIAP